MGCVVISADAELGWGFHDMPSPPWERIDRSRESWRSLLALSEKYDVPMTWAIVGHLLLEDCDGRHETLPAPPGWFDHECGPDAWPAAVRYGPDLVDQVLSSPVDHEFGCHSFSHIDFGAPTTTEEMARADLRAFEEVANRRGLSATSFVFPRNSVGHLDVLAEFGYECYRSVSRFRRRASLQDRVVQPMIKTALIRGLDPITEPETGEHGLVNLPASMFLFDYVGLMSQLGERIFKDPVVYRAERAIDEAAKRDGIVHLWLHPNNIVTSRDEARLEAIFRYLDEVRSSTPLRIETMDSAAETVLADPA